MKFSDTISFFIKESTPPHSVLYWLGPLHTSLVSVILTVTFSVLEMLTRRSKVKNKTTDGNAIVYDKKAAGERFTYEIRLFPSRWGRLEDHCI